MVHAILSLSLLVSAAQASTIDDSDLTGMRPQIAPQSVPLQLSADEIRTDRAEGARKLRIVRMDHGNLTPVGRLPLSLNRARPTLETDLQGEATLPACSAGETSTTVDGILQKDRFRVAQTGQAYSIRAQIPCEGVTTLTFKYDSNGGQALGIWQIVERAERKLAETVGLGFWESPILMIWPADGDYYSWNTVNLTLGHQWDVVGHELGHAIYDQADLGGGGGGQHKIDECYSAGLALSEGWASYFAAWVSLDLKDPDARFEYMVPRRAPIRFENIPADVCAGQENEWRVTGFFWDLIDLNADGETAEEAFTRIWRAMAGKRPPSASAARDLMVRAGFDRELLEMVWLLNFRK